ncbi:MAG: thiamine pyrophosphate-dependent enzyme [Alphaproteobacteria bacterium]
MNVSDLLLRVLADHGVEQLFGIPGDAINDVMDAIRRQDRLRYIQVRHEEAGAFAASAQAKLTGKLAACMGTAGPGAIHLLNGLYDAKMDHAPVVAITGQVETGYIGTEYHQEVDTKALFADVACFSETVTTPEQLPDLFQAACRAAISHRSVAHIALPTNVSSKSVKVDTKRLKTFSLPGAIVPDRSDCQAAIELLAKAERLCILAGIGCIDARDELIALARHIKAPIVRTLRAKDFIDDDDEMCVGGAGLLGGAPGVEALAECDVLLIAGSDFPYHSFYPQDSAIIQIEREGTRVGRREPVDVGLVGDSKPALAALKAGLEPVAERKFQLKAAASMDRWRKRRDKLERSDATPISPPRLLSEVSRAAPSDTIFLVDTGTVTAWAARHLRVGPNQRFTLSGGLASMAFALPGAIGAQLAHPRRPVIGIAGDGGFGMLMADFVTAVRYELPVKIVVLRNDKLAMITLEQEAAGMAEFGTDLANPDYAVFAEACGGLGLSVERPEDIGPAVAQAFADPRPAVIDVAVDPGALVLPPKISLRQAANFSIAKLKETLTTI